MIQCTSLVFKGTPSVDDDSCLGPRRGADVGVVEATVHAERAKAVEHVELADLHA